MAMVDRYKKSGGFIQLLQVIETCGPKKREQLMKVIRDESPKWAEALDSKMLDINKILSWHPDAILEVFAQVNPLVLSTALKGIDSQSYGLVIEKLGPVYGRKIDQQFNEINPTPSEIMTCLMKIINETRSMINAGSIKIEKIDNTLCIPEEIEFLLDKSDISSDGIKRQGVLSSHIDNNTDLVKLNSDDNLVSITNINSSSNELDSLRKKIVELTIQLNNLKKDNLCMKEKLEKIKKIA